MHRWTERIFFGIVLAIFVLFTWKATIIFFSGDDMMNMYQAWDQPIGKLWKAQVLVWVPSYRPLGALVYRIFYSVFRFHPFALNLFSWLVILVNLFLTKITAKSLTGSAWISLVVISCNVVHGQLQDIYFNAGTIYDHFWYLFTLLALYLYHRVRSKSDSISPWMVFLLAVLVLMGMNSKESAVTTVAVLGAYELIFIFPRFVNGRSLRIWIRGIAPLYATLFALSLCFLAGRVFVANGLTANPAYRPHLSAGLWLLRVSDYINVLSYHSLSLTPVSVAIFLAALAVLSIVLRNRCMGFGLLFFVITVTPIALISLRFGYVLYVPQFGLGLYFAVLFSVLLNYLTRTLSESHRRLAGAGALLVIICISTAIHRHYWPGIHNFFPDPESKITQQFREQFPSLPKGTKMLFVTDNFPTDTFNLFFVMRLLYHDKSLVVERLVAAKDQQPKGPLSLKAYDHIFTTSGEKYLELDNQNEDAVRLRILKRYTVGREFNTAHLDNEAYVVLGVIDDAIDRPRWTTDHARLKFEIYPANSTMSLRFFVPREAAGNRTLNISINGAPIGSAKLDRTGWNETTYAMPASIIGRAASYTLMDLDVTNPWHDGDGKPRGIALARAAVTYNINPGN